MCEFCKSHGDGKVWYKNASNYSQDLLSDLRRKRFIEQFLDVTIRDGFNNLLRLEAILNKKGRLPDQLIKKMMENAKIEHYGQVVPIEEVKEIIDKTIEIVRLPCACRWIMERSDNRCCYGITYNPKAWYKELDMSFFEKPNSNLFETVSKESALKQMEEIEHLGAIHTIWTFVTPFIGAICNCTKKDCIAMRTYSGISIETIFKAEYVANINTDLCSGCGLCIETCQFDAIDSILDSGRYIATISPSKCFGCGLCRNVCDAAAIKMGVRS